MYGQNVYLWTILRIFFIDVHTGICIACAYYQVSITIVRYIPNHIGHFPCFTLLIFLGGIQLKNKQKTSRLVVLELHREKII